MDRDEFENRIKPDLIDIRQLASLLGLSISSVHSLISRGSTGFPSPVFETRGDSRSAIRLWWRPEIEAWSQERRGRGRPPKQGKS